MALEFVLLTARNADVAGVAVVFSLFWRQRQMVTHSSIWLSQLILIYDDNDIGKATKRSEILSVVDVWSHDDTNNDIRPD